MKELWKKKNYDSQIHICRSEMNNRHQTINTQVDNGVRHNFCLRLRAFSLWGRLLYFFPSAQNYISEMPNGYKTDLVLLFQISRTLQKKRHAKLMLQAPRNDPTAFPPQRLPCIKLTLAWLSSSINLLWMTIHWPQTGLVYIAKELVSHPQLPPRIWPPKMPNIPQKWSKSANNSWINYNKTKFCLQNPLFTMYWAFSPRNPGAAP